MESDPESSILLEFPEDGIARITLNRPAKRNALDREARDLLLSALDECRGRARAIIITGAGGTFCAGMDLSQLAGGDIEDSDQLNESWQRIQEVIHSHPAVVIAAAAGYAVGGGSTLINTADFAVVADDVQIGMPEVGLGYYPGVAGPVAQLRLLPKHAAWMVLTAERIDGATAVAWGMANLSVPADRLQERALELARRVAGFNAVTLEWSKQALRQIPAHIHELSAAIEFGSYTNSQIRVRAASLHQSGVQNFMDGNPNVGQGSEKP